MTHGKRRILLFGASLILALLVFAGGCDDFLLTEQFYVDTGLDLAVYPAAVAVPSSGTVEFVATGGAPEYSFRVVEPGGGEIDPLTGVYVAPAAGGEFTIEVADRAGRMSPALVYVVEPKPLQISPTSATIPPGATLQFDASGGTLNTTTPDYSFSVADETVGTIDSDGRFTADVVGSTYVTLSDARSSVSATITVSTDSSLVLKPERNPIAQGETVNLYPSGGEGGYSLTLVAGGTLEYDDDPGTLYAGFLNSDLSRYVADDSIGTVNIQVTDAAEPTPNTAQVLVTILPAIPANFVANGDTGNPTSIDLSWEFSKPGIDNFLIERYDGSATEPSLLKTVAASARDYLDEGLTPNTPYSYVIFAVKGSLRSTEAMAYSVSNPKN